MKNLPRYLQFLIYLLLLCASSSQVEALRYGLKAKANNPEALQYFSIYSERCSGSNFLEALLCANLQLQHQQFCHKHFPPWFSLPASAYKGDPRHYSFANTDNYLFFVLFRNPYDWVRSICKLPHHANFNLQNLPLSLFIRTPWTLNPQQELVQSLTAANPRVDRNPSDGSVFPNVLKLRTAKSQNYLLIYDRVSNVYYINYETLVKHTQEVLEEISKTFKVGLNPVYTPITTDKGFPGGRVFKGSHYSPISLRDRAHINKNLDKDLEESLGYKLISPRPQGILY